MNVFTIKNTPSIPTTAPIPKPIVDSSIVNLHVALSNPCYPYSFIITNRSSCCNQFSQTDTVFCCRIQKSQGSANRPPAGEQSGHPRILPSPLSRLQEGALECVGTGKGLRHQQNHSLQIHWTFGSIKRQGASWLPVSHLINNDKKWC